MKNTRFLLLKSMPFIFSMCCVLLAANAFARAGGGGGGDGGSSSDGGDFDGGGALFDIVGLLLNGGSGGIILAIIIVIVYFYLKKNKVVDSPTDTDEDNNNEPDIFTPKSQQSFPPGLDSEKIKTAFLSIQQAWQNKDLKNVRKWISDGVYQRFNAQFKMMNKLSQVNTLSNISIANITPIATDEEGNYETADIAIHFRMTDEFISEKYPSFNVKYRGETAVEYWTFIRRKDALTDTNLYNNNNCPNCGAPFEIKMGEISRCNGCGTLTNSGSYDWVLSEITQEADYNNKINFSEKNQLRQKTKKDELFSVQRIEDVASNIFMQVMEVLCGASEKKLNRFADEATLNKIVTLKNEAGSFVFNRLYLNSVDLVSFYNSENKINLSFFLKVSYQRVRTSPTLELIDPDVVTTHCTMVLSKNENAMQTNTKETVYSYECSNCGAPYSDTTNAVCEYCTAPLADSNRDWILTFFELTF